MLFRMVSACACLRLLCTPMKRTRRLVDVGTALKELLGSVFYKAAVLDACVNFLIANYPSRMNSFYCRCVAMGWPALVVGHRGSGKSSIIKGLAAGVGARLTEVAMTPSVDVTELLGCFEQVR